jgi:hypothetical protein
MKVLAATLCLAVPTCAWSASPTGPRHGAPSTVGRVDWTKRRIYGWKTDIDGPAQAGRRRRDRDRNGRGGPVLRRRVRRAGIDQLVEGGDQTPLSGCQDEADNGDVPDCFRIRRCQGQLHCATRRKSAGRTTGPRSPRRRRSEASPAGIAPPFSVAFLAISKRRPQIQRPRRTPIPPAYFGYRLHR